MPAGSSWERGRRREREEGRGEKVGTDTKFFPRETWWGGWQEKRENDTEKKKQGKSSREADPKERIKVLRHSHVAISSPPQLMTL